MDYPSSSSAKPSLPGAAFGLALNAVDKVAGRTKRDRLESHVETLAQSKWGCLIIS